jgi:hypothetical protein
MDKLSNIRKCIFEKTKGGMHMAIEVFNRYEKKYMINAIQYEKLTQAIREYMVVDAYNRDKPFYEICNIYYDTPDNALIRASIEGPVYKEKLRMRSYGTPKETDHVFVEIKKKYKGIVNKRRTIMPLNEAYDYLNHHQMPDMENPQMNRQVFREIDYFCHTCNLVPKVYLSYERRAYFEKNDGDFRVTFDKNITTRREDVRLESGSYGQQLLPENTYLMEIKINRAVPLWFTRILSELEIYPVSFSKYGTEYKKYVIENQRMNGGETLCLNQYLQVQRRIQLALVQPC